MNQDHAQAALNPASLAVADLVRLLTRLSGQTVTAAMIESDLAASAPVNSDGTLNLVHFGAWLAREVEHVD